MMEKERMGERERKKVINGMGDRGLFEERRRKPQLVRDTKNWSRRGESERTSDAWRS